MTVEGRCNDFSEALLWEAHGKQHVSNDLPLGKSNGCALCESILSCFPSLVSPSSASGLTLGGLSIPAPQLPSAFQMMHSGQSWQPTCFTRSLPCWWPCVFTATPIFSSRSPPSLGRQVCPTAWRKIPSTKINSQLKLSWSSDESWGAAQKTIQDYFAQHFWSYCFFLSFSCLLSKLSTVILRLQSV